MSTDDAGGRHPKEIFLALGTRFATDITFNVINVFMLAYGTQQLGLSRSFFLNAILVGCAVELFTLPLFGKLSDRIGRRPVYMMGAVFVAIYGFLFPIGAFSANWTSAASLHCPFPASRSFSR